MFDNSEISSDSPRLAPPGESNSERELVHVWCLFEQPVPGHYEGKVMGKAQCLKYKHWNYAGFRSEEGRQIEK